MSVDEKYMETVREPEVNESEQMNFEEFLKSRGETGEQFEEDDITLPVDYRKFELKNLVDEGIYDGEPILSKIMEMEYGNYDVIKEYVPELLQELDMSYDEIKEVLGHDGAKGFFTKYYKISDETYMELCAKLGIDELQCYKPYNELVTVKYRLNLYLVDHNAKEVYDIPIDLNTNDNMQRVWRTSKLFRLRMGLYELKYPGISMQYKDFNVNIDTLREDINNLDEMALKIMEEKFTDPKTKEKRDYNTFIVVNPEDL